MLLLEVFSTYPVLGPSLAVGALLLVALVVLLAAELSKPPPMGGTSYKLPNGMTIQHWQKGETDFLYTEIFGKETAYDREGIRLQPGAVIVDAGANIGMFSLYAAMRCKGAASIYSFEPMASTYSVLKANAEAANRGAFSSVFQPAAGAQLQLKAFHKGLADKEMHVEFEHHPHFSVWSTSDPKLARERLSRIAEDLPRALKTSDSWLLRMLPGFLVYWVASLFLQNKLGKTEKVPAHLVTLSSIIEEQKIQRIDLLKVDVEGAEISVLRGIKDAHWPMIQQVVLEVENFAARDQVQAILAPKGFTCTHFASERERNPGVKSEVCMFYAIRK